MATSQGQIGGLPTTLDTALLNSYYDLNLQSMNITETELREVEREAEKRLRPFACGVGDCQRRYKNMNGLRYHYQHSGEHGAVGLALLASGQHECLQNNHSAKRREQQQQHHHPNSSNTHNASSHNQNATNSNNYSSNISNSTPSTPAPTASNPYGATTFAMDEEREGRKRFGNSSAFAQLKGSASVPVSRAASSSRTGTPVPITVPASANTSPKAHTANMHMPSPPPTNSSLNALPTGSTSSLSGALGTSSMTTPIQVVPVHVQQVNGVGINTGLPPTSPPTSAATSPGQHHTTAGSPGQQQVTQQQMQQMAAAAYQQYAQQFQRQYQAAMQMHAAQQQQAGHQVHPGQQQAQPQQSQGDWAAGMSMDMS
ncbi:hypothetical protein FA13DRAFT_1039759 [Coprinellus micaceus]|uniref:C2H2-type domain-containing protein n=1 Tax=Coprinellus micaceus TaxID=71717 RepID=A0A4Y7SXA6_COPMI|nr:hypothetical protein FA13DRAFT_1039759 [Coprinellus micaceus]